MEFRVHLVGGADDRCSVHGDAAACRAHGREGFAGDRRRHGALRVRPAAVRSRRQARRRDSAGRHATKEALGSVPRARRSPPRRRQLVVLASLIAVVFGGFAPVTLSKSAGTPPVRCAFSYNWFPEAWRQQGLNPFTHDHPTAGFYDSSDATKAKADIAALQGAKVDCSIDSWWGQGTRTDEREAGLLAAADGTGFRAPSTTSRKGRGTRAPHRLATTSPIWRRTRQARTG